MTNVWAISQTKIINMLTARFKRNSMYVQLETDQNVCGVK